MSSRAQLLLCWHAERAGLDVLVQAIRGLRNRRIEVGAVTYLVQSGRGVKVPKDVERVPVEVVEVELSDPTRHVEIYQQVRDLVLPRLRSLDVDLHVNVSPGTPAMHSVWLILHAGGALPSGTTLWSSQLSRETNRVRIDPVDFPITTYLAEVHRFEALDPALAVFEPEARSPVRRAAMERLARYARVRGAPLLILGERGTGKTRLVETIVATLKGRKKVVPVPCGGLDSSLAEGALFGHRRGAFTGAATDRKGLLAEADGGILFLDEVQDLPKAAQRKLVRVFQDRRRRYRQLGSDRESSVDVELVCASNLSLKELRAQLDADFFDRLNQLTVVWPALRECREDLQLDWARVWSETRRRDDLPRDAPWSARMAKAIETNPLPGNLRDLQRLASLVMAWWEPALGVSGIDAAVADWSTVVADAEGREERFGSGTRSERLLWFRRQLALAFKDQHGTWAAAARALGCDEKTLRLDGASQEGDTGP